MLVDIIKINEVEIDEMWSYVKKKRQYIYEIKKTIKQI